ncbi:MAG: sensor histidine kinase [Clostridiaceae bacterium]|nr:sensor histidine kinase [Clostridiaceae bacterium]
MDKTTKKFSDIITFISFIFVFIITVTRSDHYQTTILILSIFLLSSLLFRSFLVYEKDDYVKYKSAAIFVELVIVTLITLFDITGASLIYFFILVGDSILFHDGKFGFFVTIVAMVTYATVSSIAQGPWHISNFIQTFLFSGTGFIFVSLVTYLLRYQVNQRKIISDTLQELEDKNKKLQETSKALEDMAVVKERNRIAHEIHDTVGHTLTTVLVELEASKRLLNKDLNLAKEKLSLAQEQVRKGLNDIRISVRAIKHQEDIIDFEKALENLMKETEKHTGIIVEHKISINHELTSNYKKVFLRALQEGLTNGIKHGDGRKFFFILNESEDSFEFILKNNGIGTSTVHFGFGLRSMKERVEALQGTLWADSSREEGFTLSIKLPMKDGIYEKNKSINCG